MRNLDAKQGFQKRRVFQTEREFAATAVKGGARAEGCLQQAFQLRVLQADIKGELTFRFQCKFAIYIEGLLVDGGLQGQPGPLRRCALQIQIADPNIAILPGQTNFRFTVFNHQSVKGEIFRQQQGLGLAGRRLSRLALRPVAVAFVVQRVIEGGCLQVESKEGRRKAGPVGNSQCHLPGGQQCFALIGEFQTRRVQLAWLQGGVQLLECQVKAADFRHQPVDRFFEPVGLNQNQCSNGEQHQKQAAEHHQNCADNLHACQGTKVCDLKSVRDRAKLR